MIPWVQIIIHKWMNKQINTWKVWWVIRYFHNSKHFLTKYLFTVESRKWKYYLKLSSEYHQFWDKLKLGVDRMQCKTYSISSRAFLPKMCNPSTVTRKHQTTGIEASHWIWNGSVGESKSSLHSTYNLAGSFILFQDKIMLL